MKQEFVTLPRSVVEQVFYHLIRGDADAVCWADGVIKPALEQPQRKLTQQDIADSALLGNIESPFNACMHQEHCKRWKAQADQQHQGELSSDNDLQCENSHLITTSSSVPFGYKLVPMEPTEEMLRAGCGSESPAMFRESLRRETDGQKTVEMVEKIIQRNLNSYRAMLDAAPQPPAVDHPEPAYLLRDLADDISVDALELIAAIRDAGLRDCSINMRLPARVCVAMCKRFAEVDRPHGDQWWAIIRVDDLGKIFNSSGRLIATVYGSQADKIVACHNSYTQQRHKREPLENEQARRIYNSATYSASMAVFMTRIDAEHPDADDKGVSGWLQEAEDRVKHRTIDAAHEIGQAAAPQQGEQEPVAWLHQCNKRPDLIEMSFSKREPTLASKGYKARPLIFGDIAHPQPKREPLTVEQIAAATGAKPGTPTWPLAVAFTRSIEAAHNIK